MWVDWGTGTVEKFWGWGDVRSLNALSRDKEGNIKMEKDLSGVLILQWLSKSHVSISGCSMAGKLI